MALAERGAQVIATDLAPPDETVNKIGPSGHAFQLDVTKEEDWRSVSLKSQEVGDVDIVVNNAGYFPNRSIDELDLPTWRKTMATNLDAHFLSVKYFLPAMRKKKWGRFVGISSNMVGLAIPGMSHYITTKMGIIGFMRGLANDVANDGITANAVLPGLINTLATAPQSEEQKRATWGQQAIKRLGEPKDVTGAVLFLTSDDAAFIAAPDMLLKYSLHEPRRGRDDIKAFMTDFRAAFPDLNFWGTADLIAEGDYVVGQWEGGGSHTGPAFNDFLVGGLAPATGRKMHFTGTTVLKVINGKIVEEIGLDDGVTALTQPRRIISLPLFLPSCGSQ